MTGVKALGGIDFQAARGTNMADPSSATDAATKQYVDNFVNGLSFKDEVQVATTTNGTLATAFANGQSIDGVTLVTGMRILLKDQTTAADRGIYTVNSSGAPTRAVDANSTAALAQATVRVVQGTTNAGTQWTQSATVTTVGTTGQVWAASGGGTAYTAADDTVTVSGSTLAVKIKSGGGVTHDGTTGLAVDRTQAGSRAPYAADCVATTNPQTFNHALGTSDVDVTVRIKGTGEVVMASVIVVDANNISVDFGGAPTSAQYRVFVAG